MSERQFWEKGWEEIAVTWLLSKVQRFKGFDLPYTHKKKIYNEKMKKIGGGCKSPQSPAQRHLKILPYQLYF